MNIRPTKVKPALGEEIQGDFKSRVWGFGFSIKKPFTKVILKEFKRF